jgi:hypothetical protein
MTGGHLNHDTQTYKEPLNYSYATLDSVSLYALNRIYILVPWAAGSMTLVQFPAEAMMGFLLLTIYGAHPPSCPMSTNSPPYNVELKIAWIHPLSWCGALLGKIYLFMAWDLVKQRDNFTFTLTVV